MNVKISSDDTLSKISFSATKVQSRCHSNGVKYMGGGGVEGRVGNIMEGRVGVQKNDGN